MLLAEVCAHATRMLSAMDAHPQSLRVQVGDVAVEIQWPVPQQHGTHPRPASTASIEAAIPVPGDLGDGGPRPVLAAQAVGVFYRRPEPGADPFVSEGDIVAVGQQVAIIEAMKLMLPVVAERAGRIAEVLKDDGEPVEYGEPLFALAAAE